MVQIAEKDAQIANLSQFSARMSEDMKKEEQKRMEVEKANSQMRESLQEFMKKLKIDQSDGVDISTQLNRALNNFKETVIQELKYPLFILEISALMI